MRTASGQKIKHLGTRQITFRDGAGGTFNIDFEVCCGIRRVMLSVGVLRDQGIFTYFDELPRIQIHEQRISLKQFNQLFFWELEQVNSETSTTLDDQEEKQKTEEDEQDAEDLCADSVSLVATKGPPWYDAMTEEELNTEKVDLGMQLECKDFQSFQVFDETVEDDCEADQSAGRKP